MAGEGGTGGPPRLEPLTPKPRVHVGALVVMQLGLLAIALVIARWQDIDPLRYMAGERTPAPMAISAVVGALTGGVVVGLSRWGEATSASLRRMAATLAEMIGPLRMHEVAALAVVSGVAEEILFRGVLLEWWGPFASTLVFAVLHIAPQRELLLWPVFAAAAGGLFAALTIASGDVTAAIVAHMTINYFNLASLSEAGSD